jgi:hypothetical protein
MVLFYAVMFLVLGVGGGGGMLLVRGNPQWSSIIYRFQAYVYPKYPHGWIPIPEGFTGRWRCWYANGVLESETWFKNGKPDGPCLDWHDNGIRSGESYRADGEHHGPSIDYRRDGAIDAWSFYIGGRQYGPGIQSCSGQLQIVGWFLDGHAVPKEKYLDAANSNPALQGLQWPAAIECPVPAQPTVPGPDAPEKAANESADGQKRGEQGLK